MKGGKKGKGPKGSGGGRPGAPRGKPKPATTKRADAMPPKKGSPKRPGYGGSSRAGDE